MSNGSARQRVKPQTIEATSPILIDSAALAKKQSLHICTLMMMLSSGSLKTILSNGKQFSKLTQLHQSMSPQKNGKTNLWCDCFRLWNAPEKRIRISERTQSTKKWHSFYSVYGKRQEDVVVKALNLAYSYITRRFSRNGLLRIADAINKTVERKKSREQLAKSELKYRALVENSFRNINSDSSSA